MPRVLRDNGLSIVLFLLFFASAIGQSLTGHAHYNEDQREHKQPPVSYFDYLHSSAFVESIFENWESEFLQMALYVWLTSFLVQKGSAESKDPDESQEVDEDELNHRLDKDVPQPVRTGGVWLKIYRNSLGLAFFVLFIASFVLHLVGSAGEACRQTTRWRMFDHRSAPRKLNLLVRIFSELAKRVSVNRRVSHSVHFSAAEGLARIETGSCFQCQDWQIAVSLVATAMIDGCQRSG